MLPRFALYRTHLFLASFLEDPASFFGVSNTVVRHCERYFVARVSYLAPLCAFVFGSESGSRRGQFLSVSSVGMRPRAASRLAQVSMDAESPVVLNVGGFTYTTSAGTLKAVESSYFSLMLNGVWEPARTEEGHIFIDRNGKVCEKG